VHLRDRREHAPQLPTLAMTLMQREECQPVSHRVACLRHAV
jgi:hypothetical protein